MMDEIDRISGELPDGDLDGVSGGAALLADDVAVVRCKVCGARFFGATPLEAGKKLAAHLDAAKHPPAAG